MKKTTSILLMLVMGLVFLNLSACNSSKKNEALYSLDISDAQSLFVGIAEQASPTSNVTKLSANSSTKLAASAEPKIKKLFKITEEGYVEEVEYTYVDSKGNQTQSKEINIPTFVKNVNDTFLLIAFENDALYLVNKTNGRCYLFPKSIVMALTRNSNLEFSDYVPNCEFFNSDAEGNFYFMDRNGKLQKVIIVNPDNIQVTVASIESDKLDWNSISAVSSNGEIAYRGKDKNGNDINRFITQSGSFVNMGDATSSGDYWTGFDGKIYCIKNYQQLCRLKYEISAITYEIVADDISHFNYDGTAQYYVGSNNGGRVYFKEHNKIFAMANQHIIEVYNPTLNVVSKSYSDFGISKPKIYSNSDDCLYMFAVTPENNSVLIKVDVSGDEYTKTVLLENKYDIDKMAVNSDGVVSFTGLRMLDSAYVVGTIDADGVEHISSISFQEDSVQSLINLN